MDEVLDQQPEEMYDFLVKTSFLERMCAPLIEATIPDFDRAKAQLILEQLDATNLFIVPLDSERHWYRYHHLFAQLLRRRFQKTYAKSATGYHQRASQWYVDHNLVIDAVNHALRGKHFEFAANLIHKIWVGRGHQSVSQQQIFAWLRTLPVEIIHHQPRLAFHYVTAQYRRNPQNRSIEALISQITEAGQTDEQQSDFLVLMKTVWLQFATWQGDHAQCSRLIAETSFEGANIRPMTQCFFLRTCALFYLENEGNLNQAEAVQTEALNIGSSSGHSIVSVGNASRLGDISMQQGKLRQAELHYRAAMDASSQTDVADRTYQYQPLLGLAQLAYRQQRLDKALSYAEQVHRLPIYAETDITYPEFRLHLAAILATIHIANQTPENAFSFIHDISHFALSHPSAYHQRLGAMTEARLWLALGDMTMVAPWAEKSTQYTLDPFRLLFAQEQLILAYYELLAQRVQEANHRLASLLPVVEAAGWNELLMEALVLQALVCQASTDIEMALHALQRTLLLAKPEGYIAIFVNKGEPIAELLRRMSHHDTATDYIPNLLRAFDDITNSNTSNATQIAPSPPHLVEPLSNRELEVLSLLAQGLTNRELAQHLSIASSTVERHLANIYGKLQVNNRTHAVSRARTLNLLT